VQVYRFPNALCSDRGRRINNSEPDWEATLEGRPKAAYEFWHDHLRPLGFHLKAEVLEYPGGMPGDIGLILTWKVRCICGNSREAAEYEGGCTGRIR